MVVHAVSQAKAQLSKLLSKVEAGEQIVIGRNGRPIAKLVRYDKLDQPAIPGTMRGKIWIAPDFDELPEDIARPLGMID